ncbi:peroxisomal biogenesis factor 11 [Rickenella mellea]|uniref:Peroxisomal biogenesis factor 11 n=1 Tax=Rickenella mellea TaxID=50990 RepID=A0A4Y7QNA2_9AGAM|nr:peroxisomal biogenesis factor 11 [Rickenella mellea]
MATIASQVILHPAASQSVNVLATTLGRDKLYRAVQYFSRFLAWFLVTRGYTVQGARWNALKNALASGRKLMRLAKPLEHLQAALKASHSFKNTGEGVTTIARQLGYAGYLSYDAVAWASSIRFLTFSKETTAKVTKRANQFWLAGILFSLTHGLLKAGRLANEVKSLRENKSWMEKDVGSQAENTGKITALQRDRASTRYQLVIDILDVWIPAANLGLVNFNDGILGIFGFITSIMALRTHWAAVNKVKQS